MSWLRGGVASSFADLIGMRPNLASDLQAFTDLLWQGRGIDPVTLELCRLRVAMLHRSAAELARRRPEAAIAGLGEARIAALEDWHRDPAFSARERACLQLAEQFVLDPALIDDALFAAVRNALGEAGTVTLLEALAIFDGFARFQVLLQADADVQSTPLDATRDGAASAPAASVSLASARGARDVSRAESGPRILPPADAGNDPVRGSALGHQPELLEAFNRLYGTLWSRGELDHPSKEIARLRNARITNCVFCRNVRFARAREDGLTEQHVEAITDAFEESALDTRAKRVIRYADVFLKDPHGLTDALRAEMLAEFRPEQLVELTAGLALFMGFSKIAVSIGGMPESLPTMVMPTPS